MGKSLLSSRCSNADTSREDTQSDTMAYLCQTSYGWIGFILEDSSQLSNTILSGACVFFSRASNILIGSENGQHTIVILCVGRTVEAKSLKHQRGISHLLVSRPRESIFSKEDPRKFITGGPYCRARKVLSGVVMSFHFQFHYQNHQCNFLWSSNNCPGYIPSISFQSLGS